MRYIITLISPEITSAQLTNFSQELIHLGIHQESIRKLSGEIQRGHRKKTCFEITAFTEKSDLSSLRVLFRELAQKLNLDICVLPENFKRDEIRLAVFDMDSTLIQCECIDELAKRFGIGDKVSAITASAMRGEIDFIESFTRRMALLEGLDESVLADIAANIPFTEGVKEMMGGLKELGIKTALLSGGFNYFAQHVQKILGIDVIYANQLPILNGKVTGKVAGEIVDGEKKKNKLIELAREMYISLSQTVAVGDGANDLPMIKIAGLGVAFHAKPKVQAEAPLSINSIGLDGLLYLLGKSDT